MLWVIMWNRLEHMAQQIHTLHRKIRFACTSQKGFIPQLASIEQRQAHTHCIWSKLAALWTGKMESLANDPEDCYHIGQMQNFPEDLILFVGKNSDDPFMKVCGLWVIFMPIILTIIDIRTLFSNLRPIYYHVPERCESKWSIGLVLQPKHNTKKTKIE